MPSDSHSTSSQDDSSYSTSTNNSCRKDIERDGGRSRSRSSSGSDGNNSSTSSSSSSPSSPSPPQIKNKGKNGRSMAPTQRIGSSAASTPSSSTVGIRRVQLNPKLQFEQSDVSWINVPQGDAPVLRRVVTNYDMYPEGHYRVIDYFRTAMEMFITQVRQEYTRQHQQAQRSGRAMARFTWRNKGELAICFASCCDMLKLLYDRFLPGPDRPSWEMLVNQFILFVITESRVPPNILTEQTYNTKFLDWRKGGTRYQGDQLASNVRFPSADERRVKIETYLRSGAGYSIESTVVETPTMARPVTAEAPVATQGLRSGGVSVGNPIAPLVGFPRGQAPVKMPTKMYMKSPPALIAGKQAVDEYRHLQWLAKLTQITGASTTLEFPEERFNMILAFVRFCETSEMSDHFVTIMNILVRSSEKIQDVFERSGGMVVLRRFVGTLVRLRDASGLINLVEQILRMKLLAWGHSSQQAWLRDILGNSGSDLKWLRSLDMIPAEKQTAWNSVLLALEQRYVLAASREEKQRGVKRTRLDAEDAHHLSLADNVASKPTPCISTALCISLPGEFRAPPLSSNIEQDTICFLNKKLRFCEGAQRSWRDAILRALDGRYPGLPIPLWYDPYQLLGIDPSPPK